MIIAFVIIVIGVVIILSDSGMDSNELESVWEDNEFDSFK